METVLIANWRLLASSRTPGEIRIQGDVIDHPRFGTRSGITTSPVAEIIESGRVVRTRSGTVYRLDPPAAVTPVLPYALTTAGT